MNKLELIITTNQTSFYPVQVDITCALASDYFTFLNAGSADEPDWYVNLSNEAVTGSDHARMYFTNIEQAKTYINKTIKNCQELALRLRTQVVEAQKYEGTYEYDLLELKDFEF
jgi:hypothetical protein